MTPKAAAEAWPFVSCQHAASLHYVDECLLFPSRFVWLEDCGHCIEAEGLEGWLQQEDTAVGMKTCPKCKTPIYNNRRYQNIVLQTHKAVLAIKRKYYQTQNNIKMREIELILQGMELCCT